jgi:hypothetical protein
MILFALSFIANALITLTVANAIRRNTAGMVEAFGPDTPARRILACLYVAIGVLSLYALMHMALGRPDIARAIGMTLFPLQILYKPLTAVAVGLQSAVVRANLAVVVLLALALVFGG